MVRAGGGVVNIPNRYGFGHVILQPLHGYGHRLNIIYALYAVGVDRVRIEDPFDLAGFEQAVKEELAANEPSVIIAQRPCALLKTVHYTGHCAVDPAACRGCKKCMKLGCPAIQFKNNKAQIDVTQCNGCGLCTGVCPFGAIGKEEA